MTNTDDRLRQWVHALCQLGIPQAHLARVMKIDKARFNRWLRRTDPRPLSTDASDALQRYIRQLHAIVSPIRETPPLSRGRVLHFIR